VFFSIKALTATSRDEPDMEMAAVGAVEFGQGNGFDGSGAKNFTIPTFLRQRGFSNFHLRKIAHELKVKTRQPAFSGLSVNP
jgi:hypothetical protein